MAVTSVAAVVVWRQHAQGRQFLVLHRRYASGPDYEGDWAWTPPAGVVEAGEEPHDAAVRELREETGLALGCELVGVVDGRVSVFVAEAPIEAAVRLDDEHDRFEWVVEGVACRMCRPDSVAEQIRRVSTALNRPRYSNPS